MGAGACARDAHASAGANENQQQTVIVLAKRRFMVTLPNATVLVAKLRRVTHEEAVPADLRYQMRGRRRGRA